MYLLDTSVVSQTSKPRPEASALRFLRSVSPQYLYLSVITIEELRVGIEFLPHGSRRVGLQEWFDTKIMAVYESRLIDVNRQIAAVCAAKIAAAMRNKVNPSLADALIAATASVNGTSVATLNRKDFVHLDVPLVDL